MPGVPDQPMGALQELLTVGAPMTAGDYLEFVVTDTSGLDTTYHYDFAASPGNGESGGEGASPARAWDESDGEPFPFDPAHVLEGEPLARVQWARRSEPEQPWYWAGRLFIAPCTVRMICEGFQTFLIEDGEVVVTHDEGTPETVGVGGVISPPRDSVSVWRITRALRCFFTYSK